MPVEGDSVLKFSVAGRVAVLEVRNPPVNALGARVRGALDVAMSRCEQDSEIEALVLTGFGNIFSSGADIREMGSSLARQPPLVHEIQRRLTLFPKATVAALNGLALGGGLELALGCSARIAARSPRVGLPEIHRGIIPGAGGTQLLPRIVGAKRALDLLLSGEGITAEEALSIGLVDRVADELLAEAIELAAQIAVRGLQRDGSVQEGVSDGWFEVRRAGVKRSAPGFAAPLALIDCVEAALTLPLDQGLEFEVGALNALRENPQHQALRHLFFAERRARKPDGDMAPVRLSGDLIDAGSAHPLFDLRPLFSPMVEEEGCRKVIALPPAADAKILKSRLSESSDAVIVVSSLADQNLPANRTTIIGDFISWPGGRLLHLVDRPGTDPAIRSALLIQARSAGAAAVIVPHGGAVARTWQAFQDAADRMVGEGLSRGDVDATAIEFGLVRGPFEMRDCLGYMSQPIADAAARAGYVGPGVDQDKGGQGVERLFAPVVREAQRCLADGQLRHLDDIDVIWTRGLGFPVYRGGPAYWFDGTHG